MYINVNTLEVRPLREQGKSRLSLGQSLLVLLATMGLIFMPWIVALIFNITLY